MNRYKVKCLEGFHYVVDTKRNDSIVSSGYYNDENAKTVCDRKNMVDDLNVIINMKL